MKFEVGDKVVVKHSNEDGKVVDVLNEKMVMVEVRGVRFPAYTDQLDFPYFKQFSSKNLVEAAKPAKKYVDEVRREKASPRYQVAHGVWLVLVPVFSKDVFDDDVVEDLKLYLVNQTQQALRFHFWQKYQGQADVELQNDIFALQDFYLLDIPFENLNDSPSFDFEFSLISPDKSKAEYFEASYKPKAKQVFKQIEQLKQSGHAFYSHLLFEQYPDKAIFSADALPAASTPLGALAKAGFKVVAGKKLNHEAPPPSVLDLHIEKLTDGYKSMTAFEKLQLQLKSMEQWLDKAEFHYMKQLWVIHGVGSGKLKDEVHELLKHRDSVKSFVNQYHPWYGHGATEIFLK